MFRDFLLNEQKYFLGHKVGDLLTALQNLESDAAQMGHRALIRAVQTIVNQVRRLLHGQWDNADIRYLKVLQKVGVALARGIDDKDDLAQVVASCGAEVQNMLNDLGTPINSLASKEEEPEPDESMSGGELKA